MRVDCRSAWGVFRNSINQSFTLRDGGDPPGCAGVVFKRQDPGHRRGRSGHLGIAGLRQHGRLLRPAIAEQERPGIRVRLSPVVDQGVLVGEIDRAAPQQFGHQRRFPGEGFAWQQEDFASKPHGTGMDRRQSCQAPDDRAIEQSYGSIHEREEIARRFHRAVADEPEPFAFAQDAQDDFGVR